MSSVIFCTKYFGLLEKTATKNLSRWCFLKLLPSSVQNRKLNWLFYSALSRREGQYRQISQTIFLKAVFGSGNSLVIRTWRRWYWLTLLSLCVFLKGLEALVQPFDGELHVFSGDANSRSSIKVWAWVGIRMWHEATKRVSAHSLFGSQWHNPETIERKLVQEQF